MNERKSDALLSFERDLAELESAVGRGEIGTQEMLMQYQRLKNTAVKTLTESEREDFQRLELDAHRIGADLLAEHGLPVPGNDPTRPN